MVPPCPGNAVALPLACPSTTPSQTDFTRVVPVWSTRARWLLSCSLAILLPEGISARRRLGGLSVIAFMKAMRVDSLAADHLTGRNLRTSHATAAAKAGLSPAAVKRARQIAEALGLMTTVEKGRYLTQDERQRTLEETGFWFTKKASTRSLTMSRRWAMETATDHLPRSGSVNFKSSLNCSHQKRSRASAAPRIKNQSTNAPSPEPLPRSIELQRLAAGLERKIFWLANYGHIGRLCSVLAGAGVDHFRWSASGLAAALNAFTEARKWTTPGQVSNPLGYLGFLLGQMSLDDAVEAFNPASRAAAAAQAAEAARTLLEARETPKHRSAVAAGVAQCRLALRTARLSPGVRT